MEFIFYPRPFSGLVFSNRIFISDTVGNLIAFSDGTFSGETADQELPKPEALPSQMVGNFVIQYNLVPCKVSGIPESVKFLLVECGDPDIFLVESGILGFGIRNTFQGNRNPSSTDEESGIQYLDCRIQHLTSGIHSVDSRIQDCLGFPYMRRRIEWHTLFLCVKSGYLANRPQFSMVYTLIDHRNNVIKCSKVKWNHQPQASGFTAKFWTFYGVISMVYKSVHHGKLWSICFLQ